MNPISIPAPVGTANAGSARARTATPLALGVALATTYIAFAPKTGDLAAQSFRAGIVARTGFSSWNNFWYGGHHLPGYSVLFPAFGATLTPTVVGAIASLVAVWVFSRIVRTRATRPALATTAFALGVAANLVSGRLTFLLGVAFGLGAVWAATRRWLVPAAVLAIATPLASPVAGAFLALVGLVAVFVDRNDVARRRVAAVLLVIPLVVLLTMNRLFPEGGSQPFPWWALAQALFFTVLCAVLVPSRHKYVRIGCAVYAAACLGAYVVPSPMGANTVRLGALFVGPVIVAFAASRYWRVLLVVLLLVVVWQWEQPVYDMVLVHDDPSLQEAYYRPLLRFLDRQDFGDEPFRIEIPMTANHWEADYVAQRYPLARGWERQLDRKYNAVFYGDDLTADQYEAWLRRSGVSYVAIPTLRRARFDFAARAEAELIRSGLPYLRPVWRGSHWEVFRVRDAEGLTSGAGEVDRLALDSFDIRVDRPGAILVRIHWSSNFRVVRGDACIAPSEEGWTRVVAADAGTVRVHAGMDLDRTLETGTQQCTARSAR